ncbi:MAG: glycoside hydrolase, partial [Chloroflexota bacterium]|nr:glycoside hydrolase [Chloroflexota bacterium]
MVAPFPGGRLIFEETFTGERIDPARWIEWYLPHWSSRDAGTPRTGRIGDRLVLQIDEDQQPWCPQFDGNVIASVVQTGLYAGPLGSDIGQLRFNDACRVTEEQENRITCL